MDGHIVAGRQDVPTVRLSDRSVRSNDDRIGGTDRCRPARCPDGDGARQVCSAECHRCSAGDIAVNRDVGRIDIRTDIDVAANGRARTDRAVDIDGRRRIQCDATTRSEFVAGGVADRACLSIQVNICSC